MSYLNKLGTLAITCALLGAAPLAAQDCAKNETTRPTVVEYDVNWKNPLHLDGIQTDVLKINSGGGGRAVLTNIHVGRIEVRSGGGSRVEVSGQADEVFARVSGGSRFDGLGLESPDVELRASGGSRAFTLARTSLDVRVSGSATVYYEGEPSHFSKHVSKHSTLRAILPKPKRSAEEQRRLDGLQRTLDMRMTLAPQVARSH